ncbi:autotransporter domain-containing protein, partial [Undibacterium sp. CCC1.1]
AVATVSASGVITPVSAGASTITATQAAVAGVNAQATQSYSLTVSSLPLGIVSFSTPSTASIGMGNSLTNAASSTLSGGSYGVITYSSSNTAVATVSVSGVITPVSAGASTITATQAAVAGVNAQATQTYSLTVTALPQPVLTFATPSAASVGVQNSLTNAATSTLSGGSYGVTTYSSSNTAVATVSASGVITPISAGNTTITATQAAVTGVNAQATQSYSLTVTSLPLGIVSFTTPSTASVGMGNSLTNAASSTLSGGSYGVITYSSSNTAVATVSASGVITPVSAGASTITATQAAVTGVNAQATQSYSLTVSSLPLGIVSFSTPSTASIGMGNSLTNAASSTLSGGSYGVITYSSSNTAVATVSVSGVITPISAGTSTITATQAAVTGLNAQATKSYSLTVTSLPVGTLSFSAPSAASIGMGNSLTNAASSTLSGGSYGVITYSSSNTAVATVSASGVVTPVSAGTITITATQAAVTGVNAAVTRSYSLTVTALPQPILTFATPSAASVGMQNSLTNIASSTLSGGSYGIITYSSSNTAVATVSNSGVITPVSAGTSTISATQAAVLGINAVATQTYSVTVSALPTPLLSFATPAALSTTMGSSVNNAASSTLSGGSYGAITYSSASPAVATVNASGVITPVSAGTSAITASQAAVTGINAAATQTYTLTVGKNAQAGLVLSGDKLSIMKNTGKTLLSASGGSGSGALSYALSSGTCTLLANVLTAGNAAGNCVVTATKAADATYAAATASLTVQVQNLVSATLVVSSSMSAPMLGQSLTLQASITPATATGSVKFMDGSVLLGTVTISAGSASLLTSSLGLGPHSITAVYGGDTLTVAGTSAVLALTVAKRPDPASNAVVNQHVAANVAAVQRFTVAQMSNVSSHVQLLHGDFAIRNRFNIGLNGPYFDTLRMVGDKIAQNLSSEGRYTAAPGTFGMAEGGRQTGGPFVGNDDLPQPVKNRSTLDADSMPAPGNDVLQIGGQSIGIWSAGNIDVGGMDTGDGGRAKFSSAGLTVGGDVMLNPRLIAGASIGYARDTTTMDLFGSDSKAKQWSGSLYLTYKPAQDWFIDASLGGGSVNYDNHRWDDVNSVLLNGSRSGEVAFASVTLTRELKFDDIRLHPFGRLNVLHTKLNAYNEQGSLLALSFNQSSFTDTTVAGGLEVFKDYSFASGQLTPSMKLELRHRASGDVNQSMYYTDLGAGSTNYGVTVLGLPENVESLGFGLNFRTRRGVQTNFSWLGSVGANAYRSNSFRFDVRLGF